MTIRVMSPFERRLADAAETLTMQLRGDDCRMDCGLLCQSEIKCRAVERDRAARGC